jgi:DNA modification methylase
MKIRDRIRELRRVPASDLRPNPKNWRTHPQAQANALKGLLAEVGIADAVLARELDDGTLMLIDGHLRAETLGDGDVPVLILDVDEAEADKILATLDPLAAMAEADATKLDAILREVDTGSADVQQMLADLAEEAGLYEDEAKEIVEDEVPDPPVDPITKPGDLWILGEHRLLCGDSTKAEDVERLMAGAKAGMVFTDPPYGINFQSNFREQTPQFEKIANDDAILEIWPVLWSTMSSDAAAYVCTRWDVYHKWLESSNKFDVKNCVVWYKRGGGLGDLQNSYSPNHEFIIVAHKGTAALRGKRLADVWEVGRDAVTSYAHPTQKPVGLPAIAVESHSDKGDVVLDLFLGSGTTLIAAEQLGRKCYGMEISPQYCDVIVKRWETMTGKKAALADE